jgi:predicted CXXCH cytochrome family protein
MIPFKIIKTVGSGAFVLGFVLWLGPSRFARLALATKADTRPRGAEVLDDEYVGSEACKGCHEDLFENFTHTSHARLATLNSWKGKVTGCEQCHGPGKAHIESDPAKIISFKNKSSKEVSETCLRCHAGKHERHNFRRGEHWRNDVGCIDCHSPHSPAPALVNPGSNTFISEAHRRNPDLLVSTMLRTSEPQLCLGCHTEMKAQFNMPFHHKVLEGAMVCSDCHNPHGGFELKQTRLSTGADTSCLKCHTDKQGPFVFEHAPLKLVGCAACHTPHGSANPKLLARSKVNQLCLECHTNIQGRGAPNTPSFHDQATLRYQNCTTCHVKIHGSHVDRVFFR